MVHAGKFLVLAGAFLVLIGGIVWGLGKLGFRGLPGDIHYEKNGVRIWFPIVTSLVLSALLTLLLWFWQWLSRK